MKKFWIGVMLLLSFGTVCVAAEKKAESPLDCKICGMDRTIFGHSRMMVTYADGSSTGTCSINCVAVDLKANKGKVVKLFQVGDYDSKRLINARTATWVIGGMKSGVMTDVPKWAFADKRGAEKFIKTNGGKLATFDEALAATEKEQAKEEQRRGHSGR